MSAIWTSYAKWPMDSEASSTRAKKSLLRVAVGAADVPDG